MKYYIIAGEVSGDKHGAKIINALKAKADCEFRFWGGDDMAQTIGQKPIVHVRDMAFMGFVEVLKNIFTIRKFFSIAKKDIAAYQPDAILFIDYPGFNLRMAKWAKIKGYKVIYYISPTVWAWHKSRVFDIEKYIDLLICILPFEIDFYKDYKVNAIYCGNPIVDNAKAFVRNENFLNENKIAKPILALLPGSRLQEINRILPTMLDAAFEYKNTYQIVIAKADNLNESIYKKILIAERYNDVLLIENNYQNILSYAKLALVTSGTATLETAMYGVPQVVCYKTSTLSYAIAKRLVTLKYISLVNLIAQNELVKELIQAECNKENILIALKNIESKDKSMYNALYEKLGGGGSSTRIAEAIINQLEG